MSDPPKELFEFLEPYNRGIQELTLALRQVVIEELAPCCEYILEVYQEMRPDPGIEFYETMP